MLANGHFIPGTDRYDIPRYRGKQLWKEILDVTPEACSLYFRRIHYQFNNAVTRDFSAKLKADFISKTYTVSNGNM